MFESLKNKLKSWLGTSEKQEKKPKKEAKKGKKASKQEAKKSAKALKTPKQKKEKISKKIIEKEYIAGEEEQSEEPEEIIEEDSEEQVIKEPEEIIEKESLQPQEQQAISEEKEEIKEQPKQSFFSRLFGKKEETKEEVKKSEIKEIAKPEIEEKTSFFSKITSGFTTTTLKQEHIDAIFIDLELILLENNVALEVVDKIKENLYKDLVGIEVKKDKIEKTIIESLKNSISSVLIEPPNLIEMIGKKKSIGDIYTIIFFGINGSGKTTSIAKLAHKLKQNKISCVLAAADTFRAASIEQLKIHGERLSIPVIAHTYGSDPAAVAFDAKAYAAKHKINCVLIDTAGRMYTKENLIREMEKIIRVIKPDLKIFVAESITGNDAVEQAKTFNEAIGIDGIILTKADVDEKGGTILSVSQATGKPIYYLGTGQDYDDLEEFNKEKAIEKLGL